MDKVMELEDLPKVINVGGKIGYIGLSIGEFSRDWFVFYHDRENVGDILLQCNVFEDIHDAIRAMNKKIAYGVEHGNVSIYENDN